MTTFFVDRDLGPRVGEALQSVGIDVVLHHERFSPMESDATWISAVSADQMVILSRDRKMRTRSAERTAFESAGARCLVVATGASTPLEDPRALLWAWPGVIDRIATLAGPFMFGVGREGRLTQWIPAAGSADHASGARTLLGAVTRPRVSVRDPDNS